jgi:hypothetical protein
MERTYYECRDWYMAAYCISRGLALPQAYHRPDGWMIFCFDDPPMLKMLREWNDPETTANLREFITAEKYLRGLKSH